jgi:hypothetical protein
MSKLTRAIEELARRADAGDVKAAEGIRAYHGSPHDFDRFSTSQIGTGEGAQAFGYGLYFAEEEPVAKAYRDALKGRMVTTSDGVTKTYGKHITEVQDAIRAAHPNLNPDNIRAAAKSVVDDNLTDADVEGMGQWEGVYKSGIVANKNAQASKGSMYEVKIDAAAEDFLNWQTPLREQKKLLSALDDQYGDHEIVLQQLGLDIKNETPTGGDLAMALGMTRGGQTAPPRLLTDAGLKGVKYPAAFTRQKSPDKQSFNYVVFDDKLITISKKYGISIPAAAAVAAGTMTPEEAQAGPLSAGARRIIDPRFSGPVGSGSKRKGVLTDLEGMETTIDPRLMNIGRSEALYDYEGSPYILTQSDRSAAGGVITSVKGKEIDPVNLRGGRDFMFDPESEGLVWASDPSVVKSMYKRALELREKYKKDPLLLPYTMAPTGIDFATMPLDVMINYARQGMGRSDIKRLDEQIRKVIPSWKGVMNPEANAVFREVHGNKRKAVANIIDKQFRDVEGGLSIGEARAATSDAAQYMAPDGSIQNIGQIEISNTSSRDQLSDHPTYRGGLKGQGIGKLDVDIDARELMEGKGRELTGDAADIRALSMNHELSQGVIDEKLLRRLYDKQRPRIEAISEKFGVSIPIAAMALMAGPEEAQAGPISSGRNVAAELAKRAAAGDTVARQVIDVEAARLTSQGFPEDTAMRIATGELPMDAASRNARAVEQGYDPFETWYHGTADDIAAFDPAKSQSRDFGHAGKGTYVASHPGIARAYANTAAGSADANIMPLRTSANNPLRISLEEKQALGQAGPSATARLQQQAISEGFDSVEVIMPNGEILERVIFDPANIRSTNAAFDPANKGKSALLGGLGGAAVVGGSMTPEEAQASQGGGLVPFDPAIHTPQDVGLGEPGSVSTEYIATVDAPDGSVMLIPTIWWDAEGNPKLFEREDTDKAIELAIDYEQSTGKQFPRFPAGAYAEADDYAISRSRAGGASQTPLARDTTTGMGGMGVRSAPTAEDEEAMLAAQPPAPTGGDLLRQANDEFMGGIMTEPRSYMGDIEQALLGGIMQTAGMADLAADVFSSLAAPVMSAPGAIGRYVADRYIPGVNYSAEDIARERKATEDYFNYQPRTDLGQQYGEQAAQTIGGVIGPYLPAIKEAAGDSYILGAMRKGYDYLGEKEKELAKAMLDLSPI